MVLALVCFYDCLLSWFFPLHVLLRTTYVQRLEFFVFSSAYFLQLRARNSQHHSLHQVPNFRVNGFLYQTHVDKVNVLRPSEGCSQRKSLDQWLHQPLVWWPEPMIPVSFQRHVSMSDPVSPSSRFDVVRTQQLCHDKSHLSLAHVENLRQTLYHCQPRPWVAHLPIVSSTFCNMTAPSMRYTHARVVPPSDRQ